MNPRLDEQIPQVPEVSGLRPIGRGGFATVYHGTQARLGREVAVKVFHATVMDPWVRQQFDAECAAVGHLPSDTDIVHIYSSGVVPGTGQPYLVMELCQGSLDERIAGRGPLPAAEVAALGYRLALALAGVHRAALLHRDITPRNVLFRRSGQAVLADFGLSLRREHADQTQDFATWAYAAPEIWGGNASNRSDLYGLGATLYAALAGTAPFPRQPGEDDSAYAARVADEPAPPIRATAVPEGLVALIHQLLAKNPGDRPADADAVAIGLAPFCAAGAGVSRQPAPSLGTSPVDAPGAGVPAPGVASAGAPSAAGASRIAAPQGAGPQGNAPQGAGPQGNAPHGDGPQGDGPQRNRPRTGAPGIGVAAGVAVGVAGGAYADPGPDATRLRPDRQVADGGSQPGAARRGRRWLVAGAAALVVTVVAGIAFAVTRPGHPEPSPGSAAAAPAAGSASPALTSGASRTPPGSASPAAHPPATAGQKPVNPPANPPADPPANPPKTGPANPLAPPPAGGSTMDIATNYAWGRGSVSWNGTTATASGQIQDTKQYDSMSSLRIAYRLNVNGTWKVQYAQPDPYVSVTNGQNRAFSFSIGGPIKDVQWDLCSKRLGKSYCTGWR